MAHPPPQAGYDLLCPFCQATFPQSRSPLIITGSGERHSQDAEQAEGM